MLGKPRNDKGQLSVRTVETSMEKSTRTALPIVVSIRLEPAQSVKIQKPPASAFALRSPLHCPLVLAFKTRRLRPTTFFSILAIT